MAFTSEPGTGCTYPGNICPGLVTSGNCSNSPYVFTDAIGLLDSSTSVSAYTQSFTDALGLLDSMTSISDYARTYTDALGLLDSTTQVAVFTQSFTDALGLLDDITRVATFAQTITDNIGIAETIVALTPWMGSLWQSKRGGSVRSPRIIERSLSLAELISQWKQK